MSLNGRFRMAMLSAHSCPLGRLGARDTGGMSVYIRELARELGNSGHLVDVYTRVHDSADDRMVGLGKNARLIHLKVGDGEEMNKLVLYPHLSDFACAVESFRKEQGFGYDVVFSHYWLSACVGKILQGWWRVPHLVMFHTLGAVKNSLGIGEDEPELRVETERELLSDSARIIAATDREKTELVSRYGASARSISVIHCGVNLEMFRPLDRQASRKALGLGEEQVILFVGRIEPLKGIDKLLKALSLMPGRPRLLVVGGDETSRPEVARLGKLAAELELGDRVSFVGLVEQADLPRYYSASDVCVIPSFYESFSLVMLEALACGTPVVTTPVGGALKAIRDGETGFIAGDNAPERLAAKLTLALGRAKDSAGTARLRASVADFSWSNVARAISREYCGLIQQRKK